MLRLQRASNRNGRRWQGHCVAQRHTRMWRRRKGEAVADEAAGSSRPLHVAATAAAVAVCPHAAVPIAVTADHLRTHDKIGARVCGKKYGYFRDAGKLGVARQDTVDDERRGCRDSLGECERERRSNGGGWMLRWLPPGSSASRQLASRGGRRGSCRGRSVRRRRNALGDKVRGKRVARLRQGTVWNHGRYNELRRYTVASRPVMSRSSELTRNLVGGSNGGDEAVVGRPAKRCSVQRHCTRDRSNKGWTSGSHFWFWTPRNDQNNNVGRMLVNESATGSRVGWYPRFAKRK
mmetsp:Transcript_16309/g.51043  ORF Transcript_16309/g.51043 Transcript_16309/m.51043 type:complete len:292 (+) Transcript_16309:1343-2218(+)